MKINFLFIIISERLTTLNKFFSNVSFTSHIKKLNSKKEKKLLFASFLLSLPPTSPWKREQSNIIQSVRRACVEHLLKQYGEEEGEWVRKGGGRVEVKVGRLQGCRRRTQKAYLMIFLPQRC